MPQKSFIFTGISGCGKGTQINNLLNYFKDKPGNNVLNIETGSEFREFINGSSQTQILSKNIYDKGGIQPAFLACHIWSHILIKKFDDKSHLIIDGAPRTYPEALVMDSVFKFYSLEKPNVVHIDLDREQATKRLLARKRIDDNMDDINARLDFYYSDVVPALEYYKNNSFYNYIHINGNKSIQEIFEEIKEKSGLEK